MNWGNKIVIVFGLFVALVITMVTISFNQDVNLVAENYYEEEIAYEGHMKKIENALGWEKSIELKQKDGFVILFFEDASEVTGEITFFRPSDSKLDFKVKLQENIQVPVKKFKEGVWQVNLSWQKDGIAYHQEERIFIEK